MAHNAGTPVHPVTEVAHDLATSVSKAREAITEGLWQLPDAEVLALLDVQHKAVAQLESLQLAVLGEIRTRGLATSRGATSISALLTGRLQMHPGEAHARTRLAEAVTERHTDVRDSLAEGTISLDQARTISEAVDRLPSQATGDQRERAEQYLLDAAATQHPKQLKLTARMIANVIDPDGKLRDEERAHKNRSLNFGTDAHGTPVGAFSTTPEGIALLKAAIDSLAAPVPGEDGEPDPRTATQRRHDALISLAKRDLDAGEAPRNHAVRPHLNLTITEAALRGEPGAAFGVAASGEELSAETIARIACDAEITAFLLSGTGAVLKMGRTVRTVTPAQWRALVVRDTGCQFYGCDRPASWCEAHHLRWWRHDGNTDIENLGLFCDFHHHVIHKPGWEARMGDDGRPVVIPPPFVDPLQRPRANQHWRARPAFTAENPGAA